MKICPRCTKEKCLSEFNKDKGKKDGRQVYCRDCQKIIHTLLRLTGPDKQKERKDEIKWNFWLHQGGRCAICFEVIQTNDVKTNRCHLDHDHSCCPGTHSCELCRRGVLCPACNQGIGRLKESIPILTQAIEYLSVSSGR